MLKKILLSCLLGSALFAVENQTVSETSLSTNIMVGPDFNKIFIEGNTIKIENEKIRNDIIKFIKDDILMKNPDVTMEVMAEEKKNLDINIDACASCHGYDYDKQALSKSKIVSKMTKEEIEESLLGYKDGTYGGAMKSLMKSQVMKYTDEELKVIAEMINEISSKKEEIKK